MKKQPEGEDWIGAIFHLTWRQSCFNAVRTFNLVVFLVAGLCFGIVNTEVKQWQTDVPWLFARILSPLEQSDLPHREY